MPEACSDAKHFKRIELFLKCVILYLVPLKHFEIQN